MIAHFCTTLLSQVRAPCHPFEGDSNSLRTPLNPTVVEPKSTTPIEVSKKQDTIVKVNGSENQLLSVGYIATGWMLSILTDT